MNRHGALNRVFRVVWNASKSVWQAVCETGKSHGKAASTVRLARRAVGISGMFVAGVSLAAPAANELPTGGTVVGGNAVITSSGSNMLINQTSTKAAIDWNTFNIGSAAHVHFQQPTGGAALNRVLSSSASEIYGRLTSTGQVFLVNPNGVFFAPGAQVDVGGIVASTLSIDPVAFMNGSLTFSGQSSNAIINQGNITAAPGGTIALIAAKITNDGTLTAEKGNVLLGAGSKVTLDMGGPVKLQIENDALETLIQNGGVIKADGGVVWLTSQAANNLASSVINNTGVIEAQTLATGEKGEIILFAHGGHMNVGGTIKAEGGFVETSGKTFEIQEGATIKADHWLIDPVNITIDSTLAGNISSALNAGGDVTISTAGSNTPDTASGESGTDGDITVNSGVTWNTAKTLTLRADRNILVNADIDARGASGKLALVYGQAGSTTADYSIAYGKKIYLDAGTNFSTKQGAAAATTWTVITALGAAGSTTGTDLQGINGAVMGKFVLGADIDASATSGWNSGAGFNPIGSTTGARFWGSFDGLGHTITGLTMNRPTTDGVGLFGATYQTYPEIVKIRNLHLSGGSITGQDSVGAIVGVGGSDDEAILQLKNISSSATINGRSGVGGLVGTMTSKYYHSTASTTSTGSLITNSFATGSVTGSSTMVGGLVGQIVGDANRKVEVLYSYATGAVEGSQYVGGLAGWTGGGGGNKFQFTYATGNVRTKSGSTTGQIGGLIGGGGTSILDSYATGSVTAAANGTDGVGGLVGWQYNSPGTTLSRNYSTGLVTNTGTSTKVNGLVGDLYSEGYVSNSFYDSTVNSALTASAGNVGKTTADLKKFSTFSGWGSNIVTDSSLDGVYPQLRWNTTGLSAGTSAWVIGPEGIPVTYTFSALTGTYTYNGNPYSLTNLWSASSLFGNTYSGWVLGTDYNFKQGGSTVTSFTNAGTYSSITVDILKSGFVAAASGNTAGSFTIAKAPLTVTANNVTTTYSGSAYAGTPGVTYSGFVTPTGGSQETSTVLGGTLAYAYSTVNPTNAASYTITPNGLTAANYNLSYNTGTLTIDPKAVTVTGLTASNKMYDGTTTASVTGTAGLSGVIGSDTGNVSLSGTAAGDFANANVGTAKPVSVTGLSLTGSASSNYSLVAPAGFAADITQRPITIVIDNKNKTFGQTDPSFTYQITSGSLLGDDTLGLPIRVAGESVGSYAISGSLLSNSNYLISATDGTLQINPNSTLDTAVASVQGVSTTPVTSSGFGATSSPALVSSVPTMVTTGQGATLPVVAVSGGLALVQVGGNAQSQGATSSTTNIQSVAELPPDLGGRDPLGFMRVFLVRGGLNFPEVALNGPGQIQLNNTNQ